MYNLYWLVVFILRTKCFFRGKLLKLVECPGGSGPSGFVPAAGVPGAISRRRRRLPLCSCC